MLDPLPVLSCLSSVNDTGKHAVCALSPRSPERSEGFTLPGETWRESSLRTRPRLDTNIKSRQKNLLSEEVNFCPLFIPFAGKHTLLAIMVNADRLNRVIVSTGAGIVAGAGASWWLASNGILNYAGHGIFWSTCLLVFGSNAGFTWPKILTPPETEASEFVVGAGLSASAVIAAAAVGQYCLFSLGFL